VIGAFTESVVEDAALARIEAFDYAMLDGPDIAAGEPGAKRGDSSYRLVLLERHHTRRSGVVLSVNGSLVAKVELESLAAEWTTSWSTFGAVQARNPSR
jgi:hypothetical protein